MPTIILIAGCVIVVVSLLLLVQSRRSWKQQAGEAWEMYSEVLDEALKAQEAKGKAETELNYLKLTIHQMLQRPVMAMLTDEQVQHISHLILSATTPPEKMN